MQSGRASTVEADMKHTPVDRRSGSALDRPRESQRRVQLLEQTARSPIIGCFIALMCLALAPGARAISLDQAAAQGHAVGHVRITYSLTEVTPGLTNPTTPPSKISGEGNIDLEIDSFNSTATVYGNMHGSGSYETSTGPTVISCHGAWDQRGAVDLFPGGEVNAFIHGIGDASNASGSCSGPKGAIPGGAIFAPVDWQDLWRSESSSPIPVDPACDFAKSGATACTLYRYSGGAARSNGAAYGACANLEAKTECSESISWDIEIRLIALSPECTGKPACSPCSGDKLCYSGACVTPSVKITGVDTPSNDGKVAGSDKSFLSTDKITLNAQVLPICAAPQLNWSVAANGTNGTLNPASATGIQYATTPAPPGAPSGREAALTYNVTAKLRDLSDQMKILQDPIDTERQQYIDMSKSNVPQRSEFIDSGQSPGGHFTFDEIQSNDGAPWAVFSIFDHLEAWRTNYRTGLTINRGYSTPKYNATIIDPGNGKPAARESQHIYGTAADAASTQAKWDELAQSAWAAGACVEPIHSHVHADWRGDCPWGW